MNIIDKDTMNNLVKIIIIKLISIEEITGYELVNLIKDKSKGGIRLQENEIFPILYDLERKEMIKSYWSDKDKTAKKYYRIVADKKDLLENEIKKFTIILNSIRSILKE